MVTFTLWGCLVACEVVEFVWLLERRCGGNFGYEGFVGWVLC